MDTADKSADHHEGGEYRSDDLNDTFQTRSLASAVCLKNKGRHNAQDQEGGGRGIGGFQSAFDEDGTEVHGEHLKEAEETDHDHIVNAQQEQVPVHLLKALAADHLHHAQETEQGTDTQRDHTEQISQVIDRHMHTGQAVEPAVQGGEAHQGLGLSRRLHVDQLDGQGPKGEGRQEERSGE